MKILYSLSLSLLVIHSLGHQNVAVDAVIFSAPTDNMTVPLSQTTPAVFTCTGQGVFTTWIINGAEIQNLNDYSDANSDIEIRQIVNTNSSITIKMEISINEDRNNTALSCFVRQSNPMAPNTTSSTVTLTIAGPPMQPVPKFHVVNATHIKVEWDKPFALSEYDVNYYTLTTVNTSSGAIMTFNVSGSVEATNYPLVHYIGNGGVIPQDCVYLNFTLTAINDAGTSDQGYARGGFAIAPSPISTDSLVHWVTFSANGFVPMLHVNFTFPTVCDYHDAYYSVVILDQNKNIIVESGKITYVRDGPDDVAVFLESGALRKDKQYTATISVSTAVGTEVTQFSFDTKLDISLPNSGGLVTVSSSQGNETTIIASGIAAALLVILFVLIVILLVIFIARRRKQKRTYRAHQREVETDEAVQRAAQAMIPNPIYSGNPIYEEIVDAKMLKSLKKGASRSEAISVVQRDEGYVELSSDAAVRMVNAFPIPEECKMVPDKYATIPDDTYTIMNPAGTLTSQGTSPTTREAPTTQMQHQMGSNGNYLEPQTNEAPAFIVNTSNGHCSGSAPNINQSYWNMDEERYVKGGF